MNRRSNTLFRSPAGFLLLGGLLILSAVLSLCFGSAKMSIGEFFDALLLRGEPTHQIILYSVRLPRLLGCVLCGVGLSVSGVLLQTVTDNSLASPGLIGVNQGAGFCAVLILFFFPTLSHLLPLAAFAGALCVTLAILAIAAMLGHSRSAFVLSGIAIGSLFSALISFFTLLDDDTLSAYHAFSVGSCANLTYEQLIFPAIMIAIGLIVSLLFSRRIHALILGDLSATTLGVRPKRIRLIAVLCSSACAAAVVSFAGLLGFVGLIVPNLSRRMVGNHTPYLLGVSSLLGSILVLLADLLGRLLVAPSEIPVGIMLACLGAPFFLFVLFKKRREEGLS